MKNFYYFQMPQAGNEYIKSKLFIPLVKYLKNNEINVLNQGAYENWGPVIKDTYTMCAFRDPVRRSIAQYCAEISLNPSIDAFLNQSSQDFLNWFYKNIDFLSNFQSKNIMSENRIILAEGRWENVFDNSFLKNEVNIDKVKERVELISIFINSSKLNEKLLVAVSEKILTDFNLEIVNILNPNSLNYAPTKIDYIYDNLNQKDIDNIYSHNKIDSEIYFTNKFFVI